MAGSSNIFHFIDLMVKRLYYSSILLDYFFTRLGMCQKSDRTILSSAVGAGFACPNA